MADSATTVSTVDDARPTARPRTRDRFYVGMSGLLLFLVVAGFAPTFLLKTAFDTPELPLYLHLHGAILTSWYLIAFVQPLLIAAGRTDLHRRFGVAALAAAVAVVAIGAVVLVNLVKRRIGDLPITDLSLLVFGDALLLTLFAGFVASAALARNRPAMHKRLMLLASVSIIGPALGRWARFGVLATMDEVAVVLGGYAALTVLFVVHDLVTLRTVHRATLIGWALFWVSLMTVIPLSAKPALLELVRRLG